jgi:hypothetical protein
MMKEEFEKMTGIYTTDEHYQHIEAAYYEFSGDKSEFCEAYKQNTDGLAEKIQLAADMAAYKAGRSQAAELAHRDAQIRELEKELERELEWKPLVDVDNVAQSDYEKLAKQSDTEHLTDEKAKDLLYDWFGFAKEKITILHSVPVYEVNRHGKLRQVGEIDRSPLYNASDWNYIRFDCGCMCYELYNDNLRQYLH